MKIATIAMPLLLCCLTACGTDNASDLEAGSAVGSDRDEHGCIGSAGYIWCARNEKCERPWELAKAQGFENTEAEFESYCAE